MTRKQHNITKGHNLHHFYHLTIASKEIMMNFYVGQTKHNTDTHVKQVLSLGWPPYIRIESHTHSDIPIQPKSS